MTTFEIKAQFDVPAERMYHAWLDSEEHANMTGGSAECSTQVGDSFSAWDGYIYGENLETVPNAYIKQSWRTTEFKDGDEASILEVQIVSDFLCPKP